MSDKSDETQGTPHSSLSDTDRDIQDMVLHNKQSYRFGNRKPQESFGFKTPCFTGKRIFPDPSYPRRRYIPKNIPTPAAKETIPQSSLGNSSLQGCGELRDERRLIDNYKHLLEQTIRRVEHLEALRKTDKPS